MNIKLNRIIVFVMVCRKNSFKKAGEVLMISTPAVSKHIKLLEAELGINLIYRSTRRIRLTSEGKKFFEKCNKIFEDLEMATIELQQNILQPKGVLKISAPEHYGKLSFNEICADFTLKFPEIQLVVDYDDQFVDLLDSPYDLALRICKPYDNNLISRILKRADLKIYASRKMTGYKKFPVAPQQLKQLPLITPSNFEWEKELPLCDSEGKRVNYAFKEGVSSNSVSFVKACAKKELGLCVLSDLFVDASDDFVEVFPGYVVDCPRFLSVAYHEKNLMVNRIRTFIDFLVGKVIAPD